MDEQPIPLNGDLAPSDPASGANAQVAEPPDTRIKLTPREYSIVECMSRALKNKAIAQELGLTEGTVKVYVSRLAFRLKIGPEENLRIRMGWDFKSGRYRQALKERRVPVPAYSNNPATNMLVSERNKLIADAYIAGVGVDQIAIMSGLSYARVGVILKALEVPIRPRRPFAKADSASSASASPIASPLSPTQPGHRSTVACSAVSGSRRCKCGKCGTCQENARWERIFQVKFADPAYYDGLSVRMRSPLSSIT